MQVLDQTLETTPIRLCGTDATSIQRHTERVGQPDATQVGIAIAERRERVAGAQPVQPGADIGIQVNLIARSDEDLECSFRNTLVVSALARMLRQALDADPCLERFVA